MTYAEAEHFLFTELTNYLQTGRIDGSGPSTSHSSKPTRAKMLRLLARIGFPHASAKIRFVHVAGTNGKGSVSTLLASMCTASGCKTGLYTSPHYIRFTERIRVDGIEMAQAEVVQFCEQFRTDLLNLRCSFFEATAAMAFWHFAKHQVDLAVVEVGLGGTWDATNVMAPVLSVITNIGFDHMELLGDSLDRIAAEKAAIIKTERPALIGRRQSETEEVFAAHAAGLQAPLHYAEDVLALERVLSKQQAEVRALAEEDAPTFRVNLDPSLAGPFVAENLRTAIAALGYVCPFGSKPWQAGLKGVQTVSAYGYRGRTQEWFSAPRLVLDAGHNEEAWRAILTSLTTQAAEAEVFRVVCGFKLGKNPAVFFEELPPNAIFYFCEANALAQSAEQLAQQHGLGAEHQVFEDVGSAVATALADASLQDFIFVGGSSYVVGDALAYLEHLSRHPA